MMLRFVASLLLVAPLAGGASAAGPQAPRSPDATELVGAAARALERGDDEEAAAILWSVLDEGPSAPASYELARVLVRQGDLEAARSSFERAVEGGWRDVRRVFDDPELVRLRREPGMGAAVLDLVRRAADEELALRGGPEGIRARRAELDRLESVLLDSKVLWQDGHTGIVTGVDYSADGARLLSYSEHDDSVRLWDAFTGEALAVLGRHGIPHARFDATGERVLVHDRSAWRASLWDGRTGQLLAWLPGDERRVDGAVWAPDGARVITWTGDGRYQVLDADGVLLREVELDEPLTSVDVRPDGEHAVAVGRSGDPWLLTPSTGVAVRIHREEDPVAYAQYTPDGERVVALTYAGDVRVAQPADDPGRAFDERPCGTHGGPPSLLALSPDGRLLATVPRADVVAVWSLADAELVHELRHAGSVIPGPRPGGHVLGPASTHARLVAFGPDGSRLATQTWDPRTRAAPGHLWDVATGERIARLDGPNAPCGAVFTPDGDVVVLAGEVYSPLAYDARSGARLARYGGTLGSVLDLVASPDGDRFAYASFSHFAGVYRLDEPEAPLICGSHTQGLGMTFAPGRDEHALSGSSWPPPYTDTTSWWGSRDPRPRRVVDEFELRAFATDGSGDAFGMADGSMQRRDAEGRPVWRSPFAGTSHAAVASPDGRRVLGHAYQEGTPVGVFDARSGRELRIVDGLEVGPLVDACAAAYAPGSTLAVLPGADGALVFWDEARGEEPTAVPGHARTIRSIAFDAAGERVLTTSWDGTARIWDPARRETLHVLAGHARTVYGGCFAAEGAEVFTHGHDGTVRRWDAATGEPLGVLHARPGEQLFALALHEASRRLAAGGDSGVIRLWDLDDPDAPPRLLAGHVAAVRELAFDAGGELLLSTSDPARGELLLTRVHYDATDWLAFTPEGYYTGTEAAADRARVVVETRLARGVWPLSSYAAVLADPEKVAARLRGEPVRAPALPPAPELDVDSPRTGVVDTRELVLEATAEDRTGIAALRVVQDGVELDAERVRAACREADGGRSVRLVLRLAIPAGRSDTELVVRAVNRRGILSDRERIRVVFEPPAADLYVLAMGVADYDDDALDLRYPVRDVDDLIARLEREAGGTYREVHVERLVDREVSGPSLRRARERFLHRAGPADTLVVFAAGHGVRSDSGEYYYLTSDATVADPYFGIERAQLESLVGWDRLLARKRILLIDTCHAGEAYGEGTRGRSLEDAFRQEELDAAAGSGLYIFAASSEAGLAREQEGNGLFTRALLDGLDGAADVDADGAVDVEELMGYASRRVMQASANRQRPTTPRIEGGTPFVLARCPR